MAKIDASPTQVVAAPAATTPQAAVAATPWGSTTPAPIAAPAAPHAPATTSETALAPSAPPGERDGNAKAWDHQEIETLELESVQDALVDANARVAEIGAAQARLREALDHANAIRDRLAARLEKLQPVGTLTNQIQAYQASQRKQLEERAARIQMLKSSGVDFKALLTIRAPIDAAMTRRTGRGRPTKI